jgi:hypothetical protein
VLFFAVEAVQRELPMKPGRRSLARNTLHNAGHVRLQPVLRIAAGTVRGPAADCFAAFNSHAAVRKIPCFIARSTARCMPSLADFYEVKTVNSGYMSTLVSGVKSAAFAC